MLRVIDEFLDGITMYRLVLYGLSLLVAASVLYGTLGILTYEGIWLSISLLVILASCLAAHFLLKTIFQAPVNSESSLITALILFFIMPPALGLVDVAWLVAVGVIAIASKYVLVAHNKHLLNPAALAALVIALPGVFAASWWVGSQVLFPFVLILVFLVVRKTRRFTLFFSTSIASMVVALAVGFFREVPWQTVVMTTAVSGPLLFFAGIMVTEPLTAPPTKRLQLLYAAMAGGLSSLPFHFGPIYSTPELSLVVVNLLFYPFGMKGRLLPRLKEKLEIARDTFEFVFEREPSFSYTPGQYLEWTLPNSSPDNRGVRRFFTIASSPTEPDLKLGVKLAPQPSSFKAALQALSPGMNISASSLGGDFVLPKNAAEPLVWMAGGIGITPFRSMARYLLDTNQQRDIILFYAVRGEADIAYRSMLSEASRIGLRVVYVPSEAGEDWSGERGYVTADMIQRHVSDFAKRTFYLSGPNAMVESYKKMLLGLGLKRNGIVTDYFPGFA